MTRTARPIVGRREHHVANVIPLHRPTVNPAHPSLYDRPDLFDQEQTAPDPTVVLTRLEAELIASLLTTARRHLPSPKACDAAVSLLTPKGAR